jgi:imidazolonepropionase
MAIDLLLHSAAQVLTLAGGRQRGADLGRLGIIENGAVAIDGDAVVAVGPSVDLRPAFGAKLEIDAGGRTILPGFVDPHTHLVWAGDRAREFELRVAGASYMDIMAAGGGINSTVAETRRASPEDLLAQARRRLEVMLLHGTTTTEAKSGYGLNWEGEKKILQVITELDRQGPLEVIPTFLGAHAVPPEYIQKPQSYVDLLTSDMLPALTTWWGQAAPQHELPFVDVFCEIGAFDLEQTRRVLIAARELGFRLKIHADEFSGLGATRLAVELGATSADHLVHTPPDDIAALGGSDTVAVCLPCTPFGLAEGQYSPTHSLLQAGATLAVASDLNPGTAWCESMQFVLALACRYLHLTPAQAIAAATINSAAAIGCDHRLGSLEPGKQADVIMLAVGDYRHLGYRFGTNLVTDVIKRGKIVVRDGVRVDDRLA